ncbi:hypothetical protein [Caudoviricetes sp.]|nr:hypothetical protein [Caudoviricetes sp.]
MSYPVKIISAKEGEPVRNAVLRVTGRNIRGVPAYFELVEDEQSTNVAEGDAVFVIAILPAKMFEGSI